MINDSINDNYLSNDSIADYYISNDSIVQPASYIFMYRYSFLLQLDLQPSGRLLIQVRHFSENEGDS